ncbi:MAG: hypothetical protein ACOC7R_00205 [Planctomycetota bacterium]
MTTWYVDLSQPYEGTHANTGQAAGAPWGGPAGAQRAVAAAAAGDTILLANADPPADNVPLTALRKIPVASTDAMDPGDLLANQTRAGTARIAVVGAGGYVLAECISGEFVDGDTVTPDGGTTTTTVDAAPSQPGLQVIGELAADGTAEGAIALRGVAADWTTAEAAYLDGMSVCDGLTFDAVSYWRFDRLRFHRAGAYGVNGTGSECGQGCVFSRITADLAGVHGFNGLDICRRTLMIDCAAVDATLEGMHNTPGAAALVGCRMTGNGSYGIGAAEDVTCYACVLADNGGPGLGTTLGGFVLALHCVLDGNPMGLYAYNAPALLAAIANRVTHNDEHGLHLSGSYAGHWSDYNVFFGNGAGPSFNVLHGPNDHGPAGSGLPHEDVTADGYVDRAAGDYRLAPDAVGRRLALVVGATTAHPSAGPPADDPPGHDHQVSFHPHEVTFA